MIPMNPYGKEFENEYYSKVKNVIKTTFRDEIINSCVKYFPIEFFNMSKSNDEKFKKLILAKYADLDRIYTYMQETSFAVKNTEFFVGSDSTKELNDLYKKYHDSYETVRQSSIKKQKMNVKIVIKSKMLTCPYCNRDYINSRGDTASGAQLDHFYSRSLNPVFALCLYNLIPVCYNCNHIKGQSSTSLISPFDDKFDFNSNLKFSFALGDSGDAEVVIDSSKGIENNIKVLRLKEAYSIHNADIQELIEKNEMYSKSQIEEIVNIIGPDKITKMQIRDIVFGKQLDIRDFGKSPLTKLKHDILKELKIF